MAGRRQAMLEAVRDSVRQSEDYTGYSELSEKVMNAMGTVPRDEFVLPAYRHLAYRNTPLPIEAGQTISQPLIVALMTELLEPQPTDVILEVGTGSGYQAAVLAELTQHVYSIEIVEELATSAAQTLQRLNYDNVTVRAGDGYAGWPEHAPFDAILVTAAPEQVPEPLVEQLAVGGRMVVPVGARDGIQTLRLLTKEPDGSVRTDSVIPVRFVPLTRDE